MDNHKVSACSKFADIQIKCIAEAINHVLNDQLVSRGAVLFRNLGYYVPDSIAFSKLISGLGERMPYIAGMATRDEMEKSPGVMNASDDPEECTLEPHLEMCYREDIKQIRRPHPDDPPLTPVLSTLGPQIYQKKISIGQQIAI